MKRILLFAFSISFAIMASSQNIEITRSGAAGNHSVNDSTIMVYMSLPSSLSSVPLNVINVGAGTVVVRVKRIEIDTVSSGSNYLCWGLCYGAQGAVSWTAPSSQTLAVGDTNKTFTADFTPNASGTEKILYTFFSNTNANDSASVTIQWNVSPAGVNEVTANNLHISAPYPNPAGDVVSFNYNVNGAKQAKLEIYNTIGQCVQALPVNSSSGKMSMDVSSIPGGIYICKLIANGSQPVFQKLVISR